MEGGWSYDHKTLIGELIQGVNLAKQLRNHLNSGSSAETKDVLIQGILNSYEKSLMILNWSGPITYQPQPVSAATVAVGPATGVVPESPLSVNNGSPCSDEVAVREQFDSREISKKRKLMPKWTDHVRINPETGLEGPHDDGYSWRKYGQKDILGAKYPRSYYRCTYRNTQNCWATKQVQRSDNDPTVFEITYRGKHVCVHGGGPSPPAPPSPEKQETDQTNYTAHQQDQSQDALSRFRTGLRVETENLEGSNITEVPYPFSFPPSSSFGFIYSFSGLIDNKGNHGGNGNVSSPFLSPSTPESSYFSLSQCPKAEFGLIRDQHQSESDLTEIISATNSCTNSPILDLDFSLDVIDIDPNFSYDTAGFLP